MSDEVLQLVRAKERKLDGRNEPPIGKLTFDLPGFTGTYEATLVNGGETRVRLGFHTKERYFMREFELKTLGSDKVIFKPPGRLRVVIGKMRDKLDFGPTGHHFSPRKFK